MNKYVPKVGDKVRATLGENVLVGKVSAEYAGDLIEMLVSDAEEVTLDRNLWQFEQVVSVPTKFGAVIRRADGELFTLIDCNDRYGLPWWNAGATWAKESDVTEGGFTVLFEGVDE